MTRLTPDLATFTRHTGLGLRDDFTKYDDQSQNQKAFRDGGGRPPILCNVDQTPVSLSNLLRCYPVTAVTEFFQSSPPVHQIAHVSGTHECLNQRFRLHLRHRISD